MFRRRVLLTLAVATGLLVGPAFPAQAGTDLGQEEELLRQRKVGRRCHGTPTGPAGRSPTG